MKTFRIVLVMAALCALPAWGVDTSFWQVGRYEEFMQGTLRDVSLNREGWIRLAPEARDIFNPDETLALSLAADQKKNIYVGTGHQGKVFKVAPDGKGSLLFTAEEAEIFGLAVGKDGTLYVASSPEGKIYRINGKGESRVFCDPEVKYIWALAFDAAGNLFAATGDEGKILKISPEGKAEVFFDSKQTHVMCLTFDRDGNLLAGSVPNGLVYRISPQGKAFVLYQSTHPEIHDLAVDASGRIFAAALGSTNGKSTPQLYVPTTPASNSGNVTTITVTASADDTSKGPQETQAPAETPPAASNTQNARQSNFPVTRIPQGKGSVILIRPDSTVETVWTSNNESVFGLALRDGRVLFSTDSNGRIFELDPESEGAEVTLLAQTRETLATRLLPEGSDIYIATSNIARLFRLASEPSREGTYESPVKDTKHISQWGLLSWRANVPTASSVEFHTRSGNSERPDDTWSDWSGPISQSAGETISSPPARFIQWKAVFKSDGKSSPDLSEVTLSYRNQNLPPQIRTVNVLYPGARSSTNSSSGNSGGSGPSSASAGASSGTSKSNTIVTWQAEDANSDTMAYTVYLRGEGEQEWHLIEEDLRQASLTLDPLSLADGKYVAKVVASDEPANPTNLARRSEMSSAPFWIDNTPPLVSVTKSEVTAKGVKVHFEARDAASFLREAQSSVDGEDWTEVVSDDGIVDSESETFSVNPGILKSGEHIILLRATDIPGNSSVGKAVVHVPESRAAKR